MENEGDGISENNAHDQLSKTFKKELPILSDIRKNFSKEYLNNAPVKSESGVSANSEDEFHSANEGSDSDSDEDIPRSCDNVASDPFNKSENKSDESNGIEESDGNEQNKNKEERELEARKILEESLSSEELDERKEKGQTLKNEGNLKFCAGEYDEAIESYTDALEVCPLCFEKDRAILFSNRAACNMKKLLNEEAIKDSNRALDLNPQYVKAVLRRAELYEKTEKLDEALKDYQQVVELDPSHHQSRAACLKLAEQIKDRNEKMKDEMIGKLKELGNMVLKPFGLSTNNFQMQQDPKTGGYSVNFTQNPGNGGS